MLVCFVGPPITGKTTTAARLFADLKDFGYPAEFVPEEARFFIAHKLNGLKPEEKLVLSDDDQLEILCRQEESEETLNHRGAIVITDSSVLNTPLYMSEGAASSEEVRKHLEKAVQRYDVVFRAGVVPFNFGDDPHRVHSVAQARALEAKLDALLERFGVKTVFLTGDTTYRSQQAFQHVLEKLV